jgi:hypothetical protein
LTPALISIVLFGLFFAVPKRIKIFLACSISFAISVLPSLIKAGQSTAAREPIGRK